MPLLLGLFRVQTAQSLLVYRHIECFDLVSMLHAAVPQLFSGTNMHGVPVTQQIAVVVLHCTGTVRVLTGHRTGVDSFRSGCILMVTLSVVNYVFKGYTLQSGRSRGQKLRRASERFPSLRSSCTVVQKVWELSAEPAQACLKATFG